MSNRLTTMIAIYISKTHRKEQIWSGKLDHLRRNYELKRRSISEKLANPNLMKISFRTFRHWKATMEYHKTKDILHVKRVIGHKRIENTMVYTHLVDFGEEDEYISKAAMSTEAAQRLIEYGFEYVTTFDEKMIFRKRK